MKYFLNRSVLVMLLVALIPNILYFAIDFYGDVFWLISFGVLLYFGGKYLQKRKVITTNEAEKKLLYILTEDEIDN